MKKLAALTLVLGLCALLGPAKTSQASTCQDLCRSDYTSCRLDCYHTGYPGCANDCWQEEQLCLAGC